MDVVSDGYTCSGFLGNPGQPSDGSNTANINALKPPAPKIQFFGSDIASSQPVMVGQFIALSFTVPNMPQGLTISTQTWTITGTALSTFTAGSTAGGDQPVALNATITTPTVNFYWLSTAGSPQVTLSYCASNSQCSDKVTAPLTLSGPTNPANPVGITTQHVVIFVRPDHNGTQKFQDIPQPFGTGAPGIKFLAQFNLPSDKSGNSGEYQWLQLENQDANKFVSNTTASGTCSTFTGPLGTSVQLNANSELDSGYPYGVNKPNTVTTTTVTNDTASDSPSVGLGDPVSNVTLAEWQRTLGATMFVRWKPPIDSACSNAGNAESTCRIPVPLGSMTWGYSACSVNTLQVQSAITPGNGTTFAMSGSGCPNNSQGTAIGFTPSNLSPPNFGYPTYSNTVGTLCQ